MTPFLINNLYKKIVELRAKFIKIQETSQKYSKFYKKLLGACKKLKDDGEKEVIEIKSKINDAMEKLYTLDETSYFTLSAFNIINEENPVKKHGILTFRILSTLN